MIASAFVKKKMIRYPDNIIIEARKIYVMEILSSIYE